MSNKLKVTITNGEDQGAEFELDFFTVLAVGRSRKSDIRLRDADVSGRHFEFVRSVSGCCVKDLSRNGLKVDGRAVGEGETAAVRIGSVIEIGAEAKMTVNGLPEATGWQRTAEEPDSATEDALSCATGFFTDDRELTGTGSGSAGGAVPDATDTGVADAGEAETRGDFEDALTEAGDGETQEMKTRVGSMEEIYARKRQLDRASHVKKWRFGAIVAGVMLTLAVIWFLTGTRRHVSDAEGPFLSNGEPDLETWDVCDSAGNIEMYIEFPRDDRMKITPSEDSNSVDIVSFLGVERDVPFHLEFRKWRDPADLQNSLEESFEKRIGADSESGLTFEANGGRKPQVEFFDTVFPGYCEKKTQRGVRFVRSEFTRSMKNETWRGVSLYLRNGDTVYQLRTEIPDIYWKRGGYRLTGEPHLGIYGYFSENQWDSPGRAGIANETFSDDHLMQCVKRELSAERVSSWPMVESYIDTLLVRTWGEKPVMQKLALEHYRTFLDRLKKFYNERHLAFKVASANGDDKRMKTVFFDVKTVFGAMPRDRRSLLVFDPEVWKCRQSR